MIVSTVMAAVVGLAQAGYVWTLYEDTASVTLAHEEPGAAALATTLECTPGSGAARLAVYQATARAEFVTIRSGQASAAAQSGPLPGAADALAASIRTDHPVFIAFAASGDLTMTAGETVLTVKVPAGDLAKLRRFSQLCTG